jgi:hypothetical protein
MTARCETKSVVHSLLFGAAVALAGCGSTLDIGDPIADPAGAGDSKAPSPDTSPLGSPPDEARGRWELVNPQPVATNLQGLWGTSKSDVWLVGQEGMIYRFDGTKVTVAHQGSIDDVYHHVWASASNDVWVTGQRGENGSVVLHHDGSAWAADPQIGSRRVHALFGFSKNDVWAALDDGRLFHFDGSWTERFQATGGKTVRSVWGTSSSDLWFAGDDDYLAHYDGKTLQVFGADAFVRHPSTVYDHFGIWGTASDDVWLFATARTADDRNGVILHWNGTSWSREPVAGCSVWPKLAPNELARGGRGAWGARTNDVTLALASPNGICTNVYRKLDAVAAGTWSRVDQDAPHRDFWAADTTSFFTVGEGGHFNRVSLANQGANVKLEPVFPGYREDILGLSVGGDEAWALGQPWHSEPGSFERKKLLRWTPLGWAPVMVPENVKMIEGVGVRSSTDVWLSTYEDVGGVDFAPGVRHWDGATWGPRMPFATYVRRIEFAPDGSPWALGADAWHYTGGEWKKLPSSRKNFTDITFPSADVAILASNGSWSCAILRWDGKAVEEMLSLPGTPDAQQHCFRLHATSPTSLFVTGQRSRHWDGTKWTQLPIDTQTSSVWGTNDEVFFTADRPWMGTHAGDIVRWDGTAFTTMTSVSSMLEMAGTKDTALSVGEFGTTLRFVRPASKPAR